MDADRERRSLPTSLIGVALKVAMPVLRGAFRLFGQEWRDHSTLFDQLYGGRIAMAAHGGDQYFQLTVAVAPSTRLSRRRVLRLPQPSVWELVDAARPGLFDERPTVSTGDVVRYESGAVAEAEDQRHRVEVWKTGLTTFRDPLSTGARDSQPTLDLSEIAVLVRRTALALREGHYSELLGGRLGRLRRVDWFVAVSPDITTTSGRLVWQKLTYPGTARLKESTKRIRSVPHGGYGHWSLRGVPLRRKAEKVVRVVLDDFLRHCGFYETGSVVEDTIREIARMKATE